MPKHVLVIGAGIVGASITWHLVKAGCGVTIVDAGLGGGVATRNSFAWINAGWGNPEGYFHFRRRSMLGWKRLAAEVPGIAVDWCGGLIWDVADDELAAYAENHRRWGYGLRWVDRAEIIAIEPKLRQPPERALYVAEEGMVEPVDAARALLDAAVALGARLLPGRRVTALRQNGRDVDGAILDEGSILWADETVVAAGVEAPQLLATIGSSLRMTAPAGLIAHSTIAPRLLGGMVFAPEAHIRQTREGRLIAGADFGGTDPGDDPDGAARRLIESVTAMLDGAEAVGLAFHTLGHRPTPADGFPAIGRIGGVYVAVMHSAITLAPLAGELAAREIATGERDRDLAPYDPGRAALA